MKATLNRRMFLSTMAMSLVATGLHKALAATKSRTVKIGHTGITWQNDEIAQAVNDVAVLGFYGFETFGDVLENWESRGGLGRVLEEHHLPLISGYCVVNLTEASQRKDTLQKVTNQAQIIRKYGGKVAVIGPNSVRRESYSFAAYKSNIVSMLNDTAKAVTDIGLTPALHQHTGTCVETRDETYAVLDAVDTKYVKFGPDIGQLTKGGADAVQVVKDYLPLIQHMHLKDYNGVDPNLAGYCPLGQGKVNIPAILDLMEGKKINGMIMLELDNNGNNLTHTPPKQLAAISKKYLETIGVKFRA